MNYEPNSHKYKEEKKNDGLPEKKVQKVVTGKAKVKEKNELAKLADVFISEDAKNVKEYVLMDVLIPTAKRTIVNIIQDVASMIFLGEKGRGSSSTRAGSVSYTRYYDEKNSYRNSPPDPVRTHRNSYEDIVITNRGEAEEVLMRMDELIDTYGVVSVADLYDLVGLTCDYTDNKYGWTKTTFRNARVVAVRDGYMFKLPKALPLN